MTVQGQAHLRLFRFDPDRDEWPRYESYAVPWREDMRVLDALNHVYEEEQSSLAHRWYCGTKKCGECALTVNSRPMLACWEPAAAEMTCEPLANFPIMRDLVVDTLPYERAIIRLLPWLARKGARAFPERIRPTEMAAVNHLARCIECEVCSAAVPVSDVTREGIDWGRDPGPAALVRFARFALDCRDEADRNEIAREHGLADTPCYTALDGVCPQGIDINAEALEPVRRELLGLESAKADDTRAPAVLVRGSRWTAFVRLREERRAALETEGVLIAHDVPDMGRAYRLAD